MFKSSWKFMTASKNLFFKEKIAVLLFFENYIRLGNFRFERALF